MQSILKNKREEFLIRLAYDFGKTVEQRARNKQFLSHVYNRLTDFERTPLSWSDIVVVSENDIRLKQSIKNEDNNPLSITIADLFPDEYEDWRSGYTQYYNIGE